MIDIHCHILPGLDDGPQSMDDSIRMARAAYKDGIRTIIATPHDQNGAFENHREGVIDSVRALNEELEDRDIPVTILPGQETRIHGDMVDDITKGRLLPLKETSGYIFVELPSDHVPRYTSQLLFDLQVAGYKPIIVHPERNRELVQHPDQLYKFVKNGAFTQVTAASIAGKFGKKIAKFSEQMIEANLTHFVASDAHNTSTRSFYMKSAYNVIDQEFGTEMTYQFMDNAELLLEGKMAAMDMPHRIKQKKFLGIFQKR
ncbi:MULTISPECIES: tyrosine-protein phosphatase [Pontibacillus]|uniref:Tyrosine-protein phosphatase n=1 Tax=Pontibacillus chungwhensis TaxID=265426 RepID=A0ABY8UZL1_9BACI|nr:MULTISPECIES: CpsB/CapC family capsule biosynthesis tyrosine phosphatase [Pontibacillus]MCD5324119.1 tyrosine protein phosphatase [Pontibacillus sp. HN14]WIF97824.1 tyrosine protein phosphatase [Pontibacillus chungwhensis]